MQKNKQHSMIYRIPIDRDPKKGETMTDSLGDKTMEVCIILYSLLTDCC